MPWCVVKPPTFQVVVSVPFRNPITSVGGRLIIGQLQSPDFAFNANQPYDISGWKIDNAAPSKTYFQEGWFGDVRVPNLNTTGPTSKSINVAEWLYWNNLSSSNKATLGSSKNITSENPAAPTQITPGFLLNVPAPCNEFQIAGERRALAEWNIDVAFDLSLNNNAYYDNIFVGLVGVAKQGSSYTMLGPQTVTRQNGVLSRLCMANSYRIGYTPGCDWTPPANTNAIAVAMFGRWVRTTTPAYFSYFCNPYHTRITGSLNRVILNYSV